MLDVIEAAVKIYDSANQLFFENELPAVDVRLEQSKDLLGIASIGDAETVFKRLQEIKEYGQPKTPIKRKLIITTNNISPINDPFDTVIMLVDTVLHECVHFYLMERGIEESDIHGAEFQKAAESHGLEIELDKEGNYVQTHITFEAAQRLLFAAGLVKKGV